MSSLVFVFLLVLVPHVVLASRGRRIEEIGFDQNYKVIWGGSHVASLNQGKEIQLTLDNSSGSGFGSKMTYGSGFFHMRIKLPGNSDTAGVVTTYYLISQGDSHDELDFEFLGNVEGQPCILQTNVFADGQGNREQRLHLWFDPTTSFHDYRILWNQHQIVFYVDNIPIRVYKNNSNIGVAYPSKPMQIQASLWQADWATDGGQVKTNWSYAPFRANYQGFDVSGCQTQSLNDQHCVSDHYWWNTNKFWQLDPARQRQYESVKQSYTIYDYCKDRQRYPTPPLECPH